MTPRPRSPARASVLLRTLLLVVAAPLSTACFLLDRPLVGVDRVSADQVDRELDQNALTGTRPSASSLEVLHYFDLRERFEEEPDEALVELHRAVAAEPGRSFVHALAELSYLRGKALRSRDHYLAAAVYAYFYLLGEEDLEPANPFDRRFRWACDLYNRGLRAAFLAPDGREFRFEEGRRTLPVGSLDVRVDRSHFPFSDRSYCFLPADDYSVWGLSLRLRDSGLGAPLVGRLERDDEDPLARFRNRRSFVPTTAFLRVSGVLAGVESGIAATLELHSSFEPPLVDVAGRSVPLESDFSAALAFALDRSALWGLSSRGFLESDDERQNGLFMGRPYQPGLVPVVFVHGTASNPANWAEMFNLLQSDSEIRERMQFWFFLYSTGAPIPLSAASLRRSLQDLVALLDPEGTDAALRRMVIVGHSQGGLLAKMMAVDGDMGWWQEIVGTPVEEFGFPPEQQELVRSAFDFDPLPFVERVVFLSTPHRGSFLADRLFARIIRKTIALPGELTSLGENLLRNEKKLPPGLEPRIPTSLDNMETSSPFLRHLARKPIVPGVTAHSVIAIGDADPAHPEGANDGVVEYESAHIEGVESELLVPGGHSCQTQPRAIREVRRILREHLGERN
jgi:pimeloyl-ACP methyl ester carboxylesterase